MSNKNHASFRIPSFKPAFLYHFRFGYALRTPHQGSELLLPSAGNR